MLSIVASPDGKFVFASNSDGHLYCIEASTRAVVAEWKPEDAAGTGSQEPAILTLLSANFFSDDAYLITAIDNLGNFQFHAVFVWINICIFKVDADDRVICGCNAMIICG